MTVNVIENYDTIDPELDIGIAVLADNGTASPSVDYSGTIYKFDPQSPSYDFNITVVDEDIQEKNETIKLSFDIPNSLSTVVKRGTIPMATAIILDDCECLRCLM